MSQSFNYYNGKQSNSPFVKFFPNSTSPTSLITTKTIDNQTYITPTNPNSSILAPKDLVIYGSIHNPSDIKLKENVVDISTSLSDNLLKLTPKQYTFKSDSEKKKAFWFYCSRI
jgi:hypothetical protein